MLNYLSKIDRLLIILLLVISAISHWYVFFDTGILSSGDWIYVPKESLVDRIAHGVWSPHTNLGVVMTMAPNLAYYALASLLQGIIPAMTWDLFTRIFFLIPIIFLTPLFSFLFFKKMTQNFLISMSASLLYTFNTIFLKLQLDFLTYASVWWILPALLLVTYKPIDTNSARSTIYIMLLCTIGYILEIRVMIIILVFVGIASMFFSWINRGNVASIFKRLSVFLLGVFGSVLLSTFWIIPLFTSTAQSTFSRASKNTFVSYYDILDAMTLHQYNWMHNIVSASFIKQPIDWWLFGVPLLVLVGVYAFPKIFERQKRILFLFFATCLPLAILLTKQGNVPFDSMYDWLFHNVPLFNLYRESSKFFILSAFLMSIFFGIGIYVLWKKVSKYNARIALISVSILLLTLTVFNAQHFFSQKIGGMARGVDIPKDHTIQKYCGSGDSEFFRTLWIPTKSRFTQYSDMCPYIDTSQILEGLDAIHGGKIFSTRQWKQRFATLFESPLFEKYINLYGVKFVIVPELTTTVKYTDSTTTIVEPNYFVHFGSKEDKRIRDWYISELDKLPYLKRVGNRGGALVLYENENYAPYLRAIPSLARYDTLQNLDEKYLFSSSVLGQDFDFVEDSMPPVYPTLGVRKVFEDLAPEDISSQGIRQEFANLSRSLSLYAKAPEASVSVESSTATLSSAEETDRYVRIPMEAGNGSATIHYTDPTHNFSNRIPNPSFEDGLWKEKVGDCNNFDKNGLLDMKLNRDAHSEGEASLELHATRHIACTNQKFPVSGGRTYLFSFDYQSPNAKQAGFYISFDGPNKSAISEKIPFKKSPSSSTLDFGLSTLQTAPEKLPWFSFTKQITVPDGATTASLHVYSYSTDNETDIVTRYDNFSFIELPDIADRYYLVSDPETNFVEPRDIAFDLVNPTKKLVHIKGATTPFYLAMSESYHPQWQAQFTNEKINGFFRSWVPWIKPDQIVNDHHFELNGFLNGWYIDINEHCVEKKLCTKNSDGSYDIELTLEFFPQRWFYLGLLISGTTLLGCIGYLVYDAIRRRRQNKQPTTNNLPTGRQDR